MALLIAVGYIGFLAVQSHNRTTRADTYRHGEQALHAIELPPGLVDVANKPGGVGFGCVPAPDTVCLHTNVTSSGIASILNRLLTGAHTDCALQTDPCPVYGQIGGQDAVAVAFPHGSFTINGHLPPGAIRGRNGHYTLGTDINLSLTRS